MAKYRFEIEAGVAKPGGSQRKVKEIIEHDNINLNKDEARKVLSSKMASTTGESNVQIIHSLKRL